MYVNKFMRKQAGAMDAIKNAYGSTIKSIKNSPEALKKWYSNLPAEQKQAIRNAGIGASVAGVGSLALGRKDRTVTQRMLEAALYGFGGAAGGYGGTLAAHAVKNWRLNRARKQVERIMKPSGVAQISNDDTVRADRYLNPGKYAIQDLLWSAKNNKTK